MGGGEVVETVLHTLSAGPEEMDWEKGVAVLLDVWVAGGGGGVEYVAEQGGS